MKCTPHAVKGRKQLGVYLRPQADFVVTVYSSSYLINILEVRNDGAMKYTDTQELLVE